MKEKYAFILCAFGIFFTLIFAFSNGKRALQYTERLERVAYYTHLSDSILDKDMERYDALFRRVYDFPLWLHYKFEDSYVTCRNTKELNREAIMRYPFELGDNELTRLSGDDLELYRASMRAFKMIEYRTSKQGTDSMEEFFAKFETYVSPAVNNEESIWNEIK